MSGLDPMGRHLIRTILEKLRSRGKTVFFSTHILPDVEQICDRVGILQSGAIQKSGPLHTLLGQTIDKVEFHTAIGGDDCNLQLSNMGIHINPRGGTQTFLLNQPTQTNEVIDLLRKHAIEIFEVKAHRSSLEDIFLEKINDAQEENQA